MALKQRRDDKMWKQVFNIYIYFTVMILGLLYLIPLVTSEPVCYTRVSLDERNRYMKRVDCDGTDEICMQFASSKDVKLEDLLNSPCDYLVDYSSTHENAFKVITCQDIRLPVVNAGPFNCSVNSVGGKCSLTCEDGYYPSATKYTVCEEYDDHKANWTVGEFQCSVITCQDIHLPVVNGGLFNCSVNSVGGKCNLTCDDGYYPSATKYTVCEEYDDHKANWTVGEFQCSAIKCSTTNLPTVTEGSFDCAPNSNVFVGEVCTLTCNDGFCPADSEQVVCEAGTTNPEGKWSEGSFMCLFACNDWHAWDGSEYKHISTYLTWEEARQLCESENSHLVTIENKEENDFTFKIVQQCDQNMHARTGLNDRNTEGTWEWDDGTVSTYRNWREGQPDGGDARDCGCISPFKGEWYDFFCTQGLLAVCERSIPLK